MQTGLLLIALALGYKIFSEASGNAKKSLKQLGRIIGIYIMIASFLGSLCVITCRMGGREKHWTGWSGMKMCPITGSMSADKAELAK